MTRNIDEKPCEDNGHSIRLAEVLDHAVAGAKAAWLCRVTGICESTMSEMRTGKRRIPALWIPLIDRYLDGSPLLEALAEMEGCSIHAAEPGPVTVSDLAKLLPVLLREEGHANADLSQALVDGQIDPGEARSLQDHFHRLELLCRDIKDRMRTLAGRA